MAKKKRGYVDPVAHGIGFEELPKPGSKEFDRLTTSMAREMRREIDKEVRKSKSAMKAFLRRLNIADVRTVFRCHRFIISGDRAFLLVNRVYLSRNEVIVRFYLTEETLAFIAAEKWPMDLRIELLSGTGDIKGKVLLRGVRFIRNVVESLQFDYTKTDILTMDVRLSFKKAYLDTVGCLDKKGLRPITGLPRN
jgi:hypothetical protein